MRTILLLCLCALLQREVFAINLSLSQTLAVETLTNIFEHGKITINYADCEDLNDGNGYSAGRAGYTTACGNALEVIEAYITAGGLYASQFQALVPTLQTVAAANLCGISTSNAGLENFCPLWNQAATDPIFCQTQDTYSNANSLVPAMARAATEGIQLPLTAAFFYDTIVEHGPGNDPKSFGGIIAATDAAMGGSVASGVNEIAWLTQGLAIRRNVLLNWSPVIATTVYRIDAMAQMLAAGSTQLTGTIQVTSAGQTFSFTCTDTACSGTGGSSMEV